MKNLPIYIVSGLLGITVGMFIGIFLVLLN